MPPPRTALVLAFMGLAAAWSGPLPNHAIGAASGYAVFRAISEFYPRLRGFDGLGLGDANLLAAGAPGAASKAWPASS